MAKELTQEQAARLALHVFVFKCRIPAGNSAFLAYITPQWLNTGRSLEELESGLKYAGERGWLISSVIGGYRLTEEGFAEADAKADTGEE